MSATPRPDFGSYTSVPSHETRARALQEARHRGPYERYVKAPVDLAIGLLLSVLTFPIVAVIASYVLIRPGRLLLYLEDRIGKYGRFQGESVPDDERCPESRGGLRRPIPYSLEHE